MRVFIYFACKDSLFRDILLRIYLCLSHMLHVNVYFLVYFVKNLSLNGSMKWKFKCVILNLLSSRVLQGANNNTYCIVL